MLERVLKDSPNRRSGVELTGLGYKLFSVGVIVGLYLFCVYTPELIDAVFGRDDRRSSDAE